MSKIKNICNTIFVRLFIKRRLAVKWQKIKIIKTTKTEKMTINKAPKKKIVKKMMMSK